MLPACWLRTADGLAIIPLDKAYAQIRAKIHAIAASRMYSWKGEDGGVLETLVAKALASAETVNIVCSSWEKARAVVKTMCAPLTLCSGFKSSAEKVATSPT